MFSKTKNFRVLLRLLTNFNENIFPEALKLAKYTLNPYKNLIPMAKRVGISAIFYFLSLKLLAQTFDAKQITDTLNLHQINFKKVLAYKIGSVTILVSYYDFMKSFKPFWKNYRKGFQSLDKGEEKAIEENPFYVRRFKFLDTTYKRLTSQIKTQDTVYINAWQFSNVDIGTSYDFVDKIEQGECIVLDGNNIRQTIILMQKYSYQKGWLDGWGGRLYFIKGQQKPFIKGTDWVS